LHDGIGLGIAVTVSKLQQIDDSRHEQQAGDDQDIMKIATMSARDATLPRLE
jgi:hypothetical protein